MKNGKTALTLLTGLLIVIAFSCKKETSYLVDNDKKSPYNYAQYSLDKGSTVKASFIGSILDENNQVVIDAKITIGNKTARTNENGIFFIEDASVFDNHAYIKAEKAGYFLGSRSVVPTNGTNKIEIMLMRQEQIGIFDASKGGSVSGDGISIEFKAGVVDLHGLPYTGKVKVAAKYIDPEGENINSIMPGNLIGADANGNSALKSLGMVAVQMTDALGNKLQLAKGSKAEVTFPLSPKLLADAPSTIPLWYFDEVNGFWSQEGEAKLEGNTYKAEVSHFSFWNCDIRYDFTRIKGRLVDNYGDGVANVQINITSTLAGTRSAITDNFGYYGGIVPANQNLTLSFYRKCGTQKNKYQTKEIGSISSFKTIQDLNIYSEDQITISGTVIDCNDNPITNGYLFDQYNNIYQLNSGKFNFITCPNTTFYFKGKDIISGAESEKLEVIVGNKAVNLGNIKVCKSNVNFKKWPIKEGNFIRWQVDNNEYLASECTFAMNDKNNIAFITGSIPNEMHCSISQFNGTGTYYIHPDLFAPKAYFGQNGMPEQWDSGAMSINITKYGTNKGDTIKGDFFGQVSGNSANRVTRRISGTIQFVND